MHMAIRQDNGLYSIIYKGNQIMVWDDAEILLHILDKTETTKALVNRAAKEYRLGLKLTKIRSGKWYLCFKGRIIPYVKPSLTLQRKN